VFALTLLDLYALTVLAVQPVPHPLDPPFIGTGSAQDRACERAGRAAAHAGWVMYP
jgi:hypothetical protein